jgi:hypothetical protein
MTARIIPAARMPAARRFTFRLLLSALIVLGLVALFNFIVNPYRIFFPNATATTSGARPRPTQMQQELKIMLAGRAQPDVLLLGNSTMEIGLDPQALSQVGIPGRIFNLGIAGFSLEASTQGIRRVVDRHPPKVAIIGAAFSDHVMLGQPVKANGVASMTSWTLSDMRVYTLSLIGSEATMDSIRTLTIPYRPFAQTLTSLGHNPMHDYEGHAKTSGYRVLFDTTNKGIHQFLNNAAKTRPEQLNETRGLDDLRSLIRYLVGQGIVVVVVMSPYHADFMASIHQYGLQLAYERWKETVAGFADLGNPSTPVRVIDFGCDGHATREPIPGRGDRQSAMRWYWDAQHFKSELGTRMMRLLFKAGLDRAGEPISMVLQDDELTGRMLVPGDFASHHAICRNAVADYVAATRVK